MEKRHAVRYVAARLPAEMTTAVLVLSDATTIESTVDNISSLGIKVKVAVADAGPAIPGRNDIVIVRLTSEQIEFSGLCVWSATPEPSMFDLCFYFYHPHEQNCLYKLLNSGVSPQQSDQELNGVFKSGITVKRFVSHEWEELVDIMCHSENPELRIIGARERESIKE